MKIKPDVLCKILFRKDGLPRQNNIAADALRAALSTRQFARLQLRQWRQEDGR